MIPCALALSSVFSLQKSNQHGRLGFNSSWFTLVAALEVPLLEGRGLVVVNGLLFVAYGLAIGLLIGSFRIKMSGSPPDRALSRAVRWR